VTDVRRSLRVAAGLVLVTALANVVVAYVATPVDALRGIYVYTPAAATAPRQAGLAVTTNVGLDQVPESLLVGLLFAEDKTFFSHHGFDFTEIGTSIRLWLVGERPLRGASTLTQQLARTLFLTTDRTLTRKLREAVGTVKLERRLAKDEILTLYLNNVEWAPDVYGIAAAAAHYFRKQPTDLDDRQCAFLVAILPSPARLAARFKRHHGTPLRMQRVLTAIARAGEADATSETDPDDPVLHFLPAVREARRHAADRPAT